MVRGRARTRPYDPCVTDDPIEDIQTVAEFVSAEVDEVTDDMAHVGRQILDLLRRDLLSRDGYLAVLIMVLLTVIMVAIDDSYTGGAVVSAFVLGLLVLTTLSRSHVSHTLRVFGGVVTGGALLAAIVAQLAGAQSVQAATNHHQLFAATVAGSYTLLLALLFPAILRQAFTHRVVDLNTVAASLSAYLLLGLIFASAYRFVQVVAPPFFNQGHVNGFTYIYFSYITLTTVGYGDFTPANDAGRAIALLEGLFGQVFLVTIVALVVSNLGRERQVLRRNRGVPTGTPVDVGSDPGDLDSGTEPGQTDPEPEPDPDAPQGRQ
jgi:voltage-gated potassium channel Kch